MRRFAHRLFDVSLDPPDLADAERQWREAAIAAGHTPADVPGVTVREAACCPGMYAIEGRIT